MAVGAFTYWVYQSDEPVSESTPATVQTAQQPDASELQTVAEESLPAFDVARVDEYGYLLLAGRSDPNAKVQIFIDDEKAATVQANDKGEWVYQHQTVLAKGDHRVDITQELDGVATDGRQSLYLSVNEPAEGDYLAVLADEQGGASKILHRKGGVGSDGTLILDSIDYDDNGRVVLQGRGLSGHAVNLYLDNRLVGRQDVDDDGKWRLQANEEIVPGVYNLRLDMVRSDGVVVQRSEFPFQRNAIDVGDLDGNKYRIIVQPGNSLWRLARKTLGDGVLYTVIYEQNKEQIRDPDLIYPGQVFEYKK